MNNEHSGNSQKLTFSETEIDDILKENLHKARDALVCEVAIRIANKLVSESNAEKLANFLANLP